MSEPSLSRDASYERKALILFTLGVGLVGLDRFIPTPLICTVGAAPPGGLSMSRPPSARLLMRNQVNRGRDAPAAVRDALYVYASQSRKALYGRAWKSASCALVIAKPVFIKWRRQISCA